MSEPEEMGVLELGMSLAVMLPGDEGVGLIHIVATDPPGHFRMRRGATLEEAYRAEEEAIQVDGSAVPTEWAVLPETGLEVKLISELNTPVRVAVRPRIQRERG